jgi:Ricin-type beta-trefoil lectin domain
MRRTRRLAVAAGVSSLLVAGGVTAITMTAGAATAGSCNSSGANATCTSVETIDSPSAVSVYVASDPSALPVTISWTADCTLNGTSVTTTGGVTSSTPADEDVVLGDTDPTSCAVSATGTLTGTGSIVLDLDYTAATPSPTPSASASASASPTASPSPSASASPSPSPSATTTTSVTEVQGFDSLCLDDRGNATTDWAKIQIWTCLSDSAQNWTYSDGELVHGSMCANDSGWGGNYSRVILWTCNGAGNELWAHESNGEYVLEGNGYKYCLDDPAYSTTPGRQLIVYRCHDGANQEWTLP